MSSNRSSKDSNIPLWLIVLGFIFFPPVGLVLLFMYLGGVHVPVDRAKKYAKNEWDRHGGPAGTRQGQPGPGLGQQTPPTAQSAGYAGQTRPQPDRVRPSDPGRDRQPRAARAAPIGRKPKSGGALTTVGIIFTSIFGLACGSLLITFWHDLFSLPAAMSIFPTFGFLCAGLLMLCTGLSRSKTAKRQRLYLGFIGRRESVYIADLAGAVGQPEQRVIADLQSMLADGVLPMGYVDRSTGRLVLTDQGYERQPEEPAAPEEEPQSEESVLQEIRAVNDAIPDPEMSRKIDRIEEITRKILTYQKQNPAKAGELRQFLNYYLPTTLKILNAYAQMEAQGIEGANITAAKARIEGMMDKVVEGFEKQLDQLFQGEAMDITADVEVLERMLDKDGLGDPGMTLGG